MERRGQCLRAKELSSGCEVSRKHFNSGVQPHNHSATSIVELHGVSDWILVNVRSTNAIQKHCVASEKCFISSKLILPFVCPGVCMAVIETFFLPSGILLSSSSGLNSSNRYESMGLRWSVAAVASASVLAPEIWSACLWVSITCVISNSSFLAMLRYSSIFDEGSTTTHSPPEAMM